LAGLLLAVAPLAAGSDAGPGLRLLLPAGTSPKAIQVNARTDEQPFHRVELLGVESAGDGVVVELGADLCGGGTTLVVEAGGSVSAPVPVDPESCSGEPLAVKLHPAAAVSGRIRVPPKSDLPRTVELRMQRCPKPAPGQPEGGVYGAAADTNGAWKAVVPAGCWDLGLAARGFAPHTWWGMTLRAQAPKKLGTLTLIPGASVLLHLAGADSGLAVTGAEVILVQQQRAAAAYASLLENRKVEAVASAATNARGWARLDGLAPGRYAVLATAEGFAPLDPRKMELAAGEETVLDDVELERPGTLAVDLDLPREAARALADLRLKLMADPVLDELDRTGRTMSITRPIRPDETVELHGLAPILWNVRLLGLRSGGGGAVISSQTVRIVPGAWQTLTLSPSGTVFHGTVTWRDEPVEARLGLRCQPKEKKARPFVASSKSTEAGEFTVLLERAGLCTVKVQTSDRSLDSTVPGVEFADPEEDVEIKVPEGEISGVVVDEDGAPQPGFPVGGLQMTGWHDQGAGAPAALFARDSTDPAGAFRLRGLAQGTWRVAAHEPGWDSDPRVIQLQKNATVEGVRLVVHREMEVEGTLRFIDGTPVAGAGLLAFVENGKAIPMGASGRTDGGGRFTLHLRSGEGTPFAMEICQPGVWAGALRASVKPELDLSIPRPAGGLLIELPEGAQAAGLALVRADGTAVDVMALTGLGCASTENGLIRIPALEAGAWKLVRAASTADLLALASGAGFALPGTAVQVTPGGTATVELEGSE